MNDAVAGATVRPYQEQHVLTRRRLLDIVAELIRRCYRLAIDLSMDHIATRSTLHLPQGSPAVPAQLRRPVLLRELQLLAHIRSEIGDRDA